MCEFCHLHGEGRTWYLQMKNYSEALLHERLPEELRALSGGATRHSYVTDFVRSFTLPATGRVRAPLGA